MTGQSAGTEGSPAVTSRGSRVGEFLVELRAVVGEIGLGLAGDGKNRDAIGGDEIFVDVAAGGDASLHQILKVQVGIVEEQSDESRGRQERRVGRRRRRLDPRLFSLAFIKRPKGTPASRR